MSINTLQPKSKVPLAQIHILELRALTKFSSKSISKKYYPKSKFSTLEAPKWGISLETLSNPR